MLSKNYELERIFIGRFSYNADLLEELNNFCVTNNIRTGLISIIGALKQVKFGYYDQQEKKYIFLDKFNPELNEPLEIASASGNVSIKDGKPFAHLHMVVSDRKGNAFGGHVMPGTIIFAGEFIIQAFKGEDLVRAHDKETQLPLWKE